MKINHLMIILALALFLTFTLATDVSAVDIDNTTIGGIRESVKEDVAINLKDGIYTGENNTEIVVSKNLTISGSSQNGTIIDGSGSKRIFTVEENSTLTLINLSFKNTYSSSNGGAIYSSGKVNLINCNFLNNNAKNGGAIYNNGGILNISNSNFVTNHATVNGGAIYTNGGQTTISGTSFTNDVSGNLGNAIYINNCNSDCRVLVNNNNFYSLGNTSNFAVVVENLNQNNATNDSNGNVNLNYNTWNNADSTLPSVYGVAVNNYYVNKALIKQVNLKVTTSDYYKGKVTITCEVYDEDGFVDGDVAFFINGVFSGREPIVNGQASVLTI